MYLLAADDHTMTGIWKSVETVGPIGAFIVLVVVAFIVLYTKIIQP